jgi:hypothetical protein
MDTRHSAETYRVWAHDNQVYGPIEFAVLVQWVHEQRVFPSTWIYLEKQEEWLPAGKVEPLHDYFSAQIGASVLNHRSPETDPVTAEELRQFTILSSLSNEEIVKATRLGELRHIRSGEIILKKDDPGDAMYFVLSGNVRARLLVGRDDKTLTRIPAGEFFGEMAMFTQSPRSADVVADGDTRLLRFSAKAFHQLISETPEAAAPVLFAIARTMANRISQDNWRFQKEVASEFTWR